MEDKFTTTKLWSESLPILRTIAAIEGKFNYEVIHELLVEKFEQVRGKLPQDGRHRDDNKKPSVDS